MVRYELAKARHLRATVGKRVADRVLHERVCDKNPKRGEVAADGDQPNARAVRLLRELVPAEHPDAEERGLEEERRQCLERERCAENIAHEARILRPVHTKLEFLHKTRNNAHGEIDEKQRAEKFQQLAAGFLPLRILRPHIACLEQRDENRHAERERNEEKVVDRRDGKLPSRQQHFFHFQNPPKKIK